MSQAIRQMKHNDRKLICVAKLHPETRSNMMLKIAAYFMTIIMRTF